MEHLDDSSNTKALYFRVVKQGSPAIAWEDGKMRCSR
jgi:hypothetical protein